MFRKVVELDWKKEGLAMFPPRFSSSCKELFPRCKNLAWLRRAGWLREGHGCMPQRGGPACDESGRNALLVARAELLMKAAATSLHLPPASIASTTEGQH